MTLAEIENALQAARRGIFALDDEVANAAIAEVKRLQALLISHPDEVARKAKLKAKGDAAIAFRWL